MLQAGFSFDRLIAPISRSAFLRDYYEAAPLLLHRGEPGYWDELLRLDQVWQHIEGHCPGPNSIRLVKYGSNQDSDDYIGPNRRADPARVAAMYADGWTVALNSMQDRLPQLGSLCAAAESVFSAPFQTNLYLTPPDAQGFIPHWDTHDVFVLQVHGSKRWTLYDSPLELPLITQSFNEAKTPPGPVSAEFTLQAGDLLYVPRGLMHAAHSGPDESLHITFGLLAKTWADLILEAVSKAILTDPSLRRNLPFGYARAEFDRGTAAAEFALLMGTVARHADFDAAFDGLREQFVGGRVPRRPGQNAQLARLDALTPWSRAGVRPDLMWYLAGDEDELQLCHVTGTLTFPGFARDAVKAAMDSPAFVVSDLPGPLDEAGKVTLVRRLIKEGLVQALG